jgi:Flp pilus assembly protein TadD
VVLAIRLVLLTVALAACAWFALGARASHDTDVASSILNASGSLTTQQAQAALSDIAGAETLNPDQTLEILRAQVEFHSGNVAGAVAIAKRVVRREPKNADAWVVLEVLSRRLDPAENRLAQMRVSQLVPPVPAT